MIDSVGKGSRGKDPQFCKRKTIWMLGSLGTAGVWTSRPQDGWPAASFRYGSTKNCIMGKRGDRGGGEW